MNSYNAIGRWVRDHEVATVGDKGTTLVKNTIAVDHPYKKDSSSFLRTVMWGKTGELASQYTGKGSLVGIEGHLETGSYEDKDGKKIFTTDVVVERVKFLDSKKDSQAPKNEQQAPQQERYQKPDNDPFSTEGGAIPVGGPIEVSDDDLPF